MCISWTQYSASCGKSLGRKAEVVDSGMPSRSAAISDTNGSGVSDSSRLIRRGLPRAMASQRSRQKEVHHNLRNRERCRSVMDVLYPAESISRWSPRIWQILMARPLQCHGCIWSSFSEFQKPSSNAPCRRIKLFFSPPLLYMHYAQSISLHCTGEE